MFEAKKFNFDKLDKNAKKKLYDQLERTEGELGRELKIEETPDMIGLELDGEEGEKKKRWFMKMEDFPVDDGYEKLEDVIEASAKFPNLPISEAVKKIKELRNKKGD